MKATVWILAVTLLLTACAAQTGGPSAAPEAPAEIPTLLWWNVGPAPTDYEAGMENINRYLEANMGLRLDLRLLPWLNLMERSQIIVNAGETFDLMFVDSENYNKFATLGAFQDVTDMLRTTAPELWEFIPDTVWTGAMLGGRIYAVPTYKDVALAQYWVFDAALAERCGIDINALVTWGDLDTALRTIKEIEGEDFYPVQLSRNEVFNGVYNGFDSFGSGLPVIGVRVYDPTRTVWNLLEDPVFLSRLRMLREWYKAGIINPDANVLTENNAPEPFFSAIGWPGAEQVWQRNRGSERYVSKLNYGPVLSSETIQGSMNAVGRQSRYQTEALQLLQRINLNPKLRDMFAYGVEGTHFEYVSDRVVRQFNNNWNVEVFSQGTFFTMSTTVEAAPDQWEQVKAQNESALSSVLLGFNMSIGELSTELSACKAIWSRYSPDLLTGAAEPDETIAQCLAEMRAAGLDIILSEAQKQIDRHFRGGG
jgi:putative aldouronate transport system substrate-binding protein